MYPAGLDVDQPSRASIEALGAGGIEGALLYRVAAPEVFGPMMREGKSKGAC
jgi:hypothetical protein